MTVLLRDVSPVFIVNQVQITLITIKWCWLFAVRHKISFITLRILTQPSLFNIILIFSKQMLFWCYYIPLFVTRSTFNISIKFSHPEINEASFSWSSYRHVDYFQRICGNDTISKSVFTFSEIRINTWARIARNRLLSEWVCVYLNSLNLLFSKVTALGSIRNNILIYDVSQINFVSNYQQKKKQLLNREWFEHRSWPIRNRACFHSRIEWCMPRNDLISFLSIC